MISYDNRISYAIIRSQNRKEHFKRWGLQKVGKVAVAPQVTPSHPVDLNINDRALRNQLGVFPNVLNGIGCRRGGLEAVKIDLL
jgi:hypothetical protein